MNRFYERGMRKLTKNLRLEVVLARLRDLHLYHRDMKRVNLRYMDRIRYNNSNVIDVDTVVEDEDSDDFARERYMAECEHNDCHRTECLQKQNRTLNVKNIIAAGQNGK